VQEVHGGFVVEEVVMQRRDLEAGGEQLRHHRVDLVLEQDEVAHDHRLRDAGPTRRERGPGCEAKEGR
jgi:hypothetical protein